MSQLEVEDSSSPLERLPGELRLRVLTSIPDLTTLRSLVHASPVLHASYFHNRDTVLRTCLGRELDGLLVDAYATLMSRVGTLGSPRTNEMIVSFLDGYKGWLSGSSPCPELESISPSSLRWMAAFQAFVARPLALRYAGSALANLREDTAADTAAAAMAGIPAESEDIDDCRSRSEEIRVLRALYRFQTFCHLFGRNKGQRVGGFDLHQIIEVFFGLFEPWEAEAVGCIELFVRDKYEDIFHEVKEDINLGEAHQTYMRGTISRGLKVTVRLLAIHDHDTLVTKLRRCLTNTIYRDFPIDALFSFTVQFERRDISGTNARDEAEQRMDPLVFQGDTVPPMGPPFAWTVLWNGKYANLYGAYVPEPLRRWGYVM
ncbi:hypothetical protein DV735_g1076, partial [Chaetothyriales sp. CBS 134920]